MTASIVTEFDMQNPTVVADVLAPVLGERIGAVLGDVRQAVSVLQGAAQLLQSGDGLNISTSMASIINSYTTWLRNRIEANAEETRINRQRHQVHFMKDTPIAWKVHKDVGATLPPIQVRLKRGPGIKMSDMLNQFAPGACFEFKRLGYNIIRRSFERTYYPNVFDDGQPEIVEAVAELSDEERQPLVCISDGAASLNGQGCCYYPGESVQFSFGTFPYIHGKSIVSSTPVDPEIPLIRHAALMTPSAHHVLLDEQEVYEVYKHFLKRTRLSEIPRIGKGQKDPGIYLDEQNLPRTIGGGQYWEVRYDDGNKNRIKGDALRDVAAAFHQFFVVRQMVLRQFGWLAPSVKKAAEDSRDPRIRKLARGEKIELWKWDPHDPLVQLEKIPEGAPPKSGQGKKAPPPASPLPSEPKEDTADKPSKRPPRKGREDAPVVDRARWINVGVAIAGIAGVAYLGRHQLAAWVRKRRRKQLPPSNANK